MKIISIFITLMSLRIFTNAQIADSRRREVKLQGAVNFRDIGGYGTKDGKHVKWGKLYRSADLGRLTDADLNKLDQLPIAYIADVRGPLKVKTAPDRIPAKAKRISLAAGSEHTGGSNYMKKC